MVCGRRDRPDPRGNVVRRGAHVVRPPLKDIIYQIKFQKVWQKYSLISGHFRLALMPIANYGIFPLPK
jgi:hypothetical protein